MNRKQAGIGLGVGVAAFVGLIALSGQYVPPTGPLQTIQSLIVKSGFTNQGPLVESGVIRPTGVTGTLDNWAPTGIATASTIYATLSGDATLTSIAASQVDGRVLRLCASGDFTLTLDDAASTGTAANKLALAGGIDWLLTSGDNRCVTLRYDGTATRWKADSTAMPVCESGERLEYQSGTWRCRFLNDYRSKSLIFSNEFLTASNVDWLQGTASGIGANSGTTVNTTTRPVLLDLQTGTTSTGLSRWHSANSTLFDFGSMSSAVWEATVGFPTLSTVSEEYASNLGFFSDPTAVNQANGCWFSYDRLPVATAPGTGTITAGANKWQCWCASGSTRTGYTMDGTIVSQGGFTTVDAPIAATVLSSTSGVDSTNLNHLKIVVTGTTRAEFYVDSGSGSTKRCEITSNIPSGTGRPTQGFYILKSAGSTSRSLYVDWIRLNLNYSSARSP